jgi:PAS domain S-box-containing protein
MIQTARFSSWSAGLSQVAYVAGVGVAVGLLAYVCIELPRDLGQITPIWLANAFMLAVLLRAPTKQWAWLILSSSVGNALAVLHAGGHLKTVLGLTFADFAEYMFCALALRRVLGPKIDVSQPRDLIWLAAICGVCAPLMSSVISATVFYYARHADFFQSMTSWILSNSLGLMLVTPSMIAFQQAKSLLAERPITTGGLVSLAALIVVTLVVFYFSHYPLLFLIPPVLAFVALEMEMLGAAIGIVALAALTIAFTVFDFGPMARLSSDMEDRALFLQVFLVVSIFAALPLATVNTQRRRLRDVAQDQSRWAEMAEGLAGVGYWRLHLATDVMTWSDQMHAIMGQQSGEKSPKDFMAAIHPDDRDIVLRRYQTLLTSSGPRANAITRLQRPDGEVRYATASTIVERDADGRPVILFGVVMDVTAQKRAELAISDSEARFRMLAENGSDVLAHSGLDGLISYVSPSVEYRLGYTPEEMIGRSFLDFIHPEDIPAVQTVVKGQFQAREKAQPMRVEYRSRHKDGRELWFEARPTLVFDPVTGKITGVTDVVRDITRRKALEIELRQARADAEAAAAVKGEFLANMSHELRTPLTAVLGFTKLVEDQPELSVETRGYVERVSNAGKALRATVNDILDFSKLEAGQVDIKPRAISPAELTREAVELFEAQAQAKGLTLMTEGLEALPPRLLVDPDRLRQILLNLIGNAVKFTEVGGVEVAADFDTASGRLAFSVTDHGPGMPSDRVGQLFQRFSQVDGSSTRKYGGTGLGLAICKGLAEAMGGEIGVESHEGRGSRFWFSVPATTVDQDEEHDDGDGPLLELPENCRILIVDDNLANRELVRAILAPFGADMTDATDGDEAITSAHDTPFDLILMDLRMPRVDGRTAAARIREGGANAKTPILAFSADASTLTIDDVFDGQIAKPLSAMGLIETCARTLATSRT